MSKIHLIRGEYTACGRVKSTVTCVSWQIYDGLRYSYKCLKCWKNYQIKGKPKDQK